MTRSFSTKLSALLGILELAGIRPAQASDPACASITVQADSDVNRSWPGLSENVAKAFEARRDIDACARVKLFMGGGSVIVEVVLPDGRSTSRAVPLPEDVVPMVEALLLVPYQQEPKARPPQASESVAEPSSTPSNAAPANILQSTESKPKPTAQVREAKVPEPQHSPRSVGIDISLFMNARIGADQVGYGLGARSLLEVSGWLVGFEGRLDAYEQLTGGARVGALELAALGARRIRFAEYALDLSVGAGLAIGGTSKVAVAQGGSETVIETGNGIAPRLILATRLNFKSRAVLHPFVGLDGEIGPNNAPQVSVDVARLPTYSLGLSLGVTVGTH